MSATVDSAAAEGTVLAGRYRLRRLVAALPGGDTALWHGEDEVLARSVAVKVLHGADPGQTQRFLANAVRAGRVSHPAIASVYDAAEADGRAYVVREWVEGTPLDELLSDGPMAPPDAAALVARVAEAVAAAHRAGVPHGALHPANVIVTPAGAVKLTDAGGAGADGAGADDSPDGAPAGAVHAVDVRALGALLYATLTGRWPAPPERAGRAPAASHVLAPAPYADDRLCSPLQVRAGVPGELDALTMQALDADGSPGSPGAADVQRALSLHAARSARGHLRSTRAAGGPLPAHVDDASLGGDGGDGDDRERGSRLRRVLVPVGVLAAIALAGWVVGIGLGNIPAPGGGYTSLQRKAPPAAGNRARAAAARPEPVKVVDAESFDPFGDGRESPGRVGNTHDGTPDTAWQTDRYRTARFGNLKSGVGVLFDLGDPVAVKRVALRVEADGGAVQLRAAARRGTQPSDYAIVAEATPSAAGTSLTPRTPTTARYWLLWVTELPPASGGYRLGVGEVTFLR